MLNEHPTPSERPVLDLTTPGNVCEARAFVGWKFGKDGTPLWRVCCDCEDKGRVEAEARRLGLGVTHTFCTTHFKARMNAITGDRSDL